MRTTALALLSGERGVDRASQGRRESGLGAGGSQPEPAVRGPSSSVDSSARSAAWCGGQTHRGKATGPWGMCWGRGASVTPRGDGRLHAEPEEDGEVEAAGTGRYGAAANCCWEWSVCLCH